MVRRGACALFLMVFAGLVAPPAFATAPVAAPDLARVERSLADLGVPLVMNTGQWDPAAAFGATLFSGSFFVTTSGRLVYSLPAKDGGSGAVLVESLVDGAGHDVALKPAGLVPDRAKTSYLIGDAHRQADPATTWERVRLGSPYPGVDVQLRATGRNVEKIFTVAPGRDAAAIRVRVAGAERLALGAGGELVARTAHGPVAYTPPVAYQEDAAGRRESVEVHYALAGSDGYGFVLGAYDRARPVVIDPLLQSTYFGGSGSDRVLAVAILPGGDILAAGLTNSTNLPCVPAGGPCTGAQTGATASGDGFVARLSGDLTTLQQMTYFGGSGNDQILALAVHPDGDVIIAGTTTSTDLPCTTLAGACVSAAPRASTGTQDGFVARLNASLTSVLQTTYFGGTGNDAFNAIAVSPVTGEIIAVGAGTSNDLPCTTAAGACAAGAQSAYPASPAGTQVGFAARYSTTLGLQQATYFGGAAGGSLRAVAVRPITGEVVVGGVGNPGLPCTTTATMGCGNGAYTTPATSALARLNSTLTGFLQATFTPAEWNGVTALALHPLTGDIYATGETTNSLGPSPCTTSATPGCGDGAQPAINGAADALVMRFNPTLTALLQATYLGGSGTEIPRALVIHPTTGEIYVAGLTSSIDFPCLTAATTNCGVGAVIGPSSAGLYTGFVARLSMDLTRLLQASLRGASPTGLSFATNALAFRAGGAEIVVAGDVTQSDLPCTTSATAGCGNGAQQASGGGTDGFVQRISADLTAGDHVPDAIAFTPQLGVGLGTVRTSNPVQITGIAAGADLYVDGQPGSTYCISTASGCGCDVSLGFTSARSFIDPGQWVCVRHTAAAQTGTTTTTNLHVGGGMGVFQATTGATGSAGCSLDVDGNGAIDALTDGLVLIRAMFGLSGTAVTSGAVGSGAARATWADIRNFLNSNCGTVFP